MIFKWICLGNSKIGKAGPVQLGNILAKHGGFGCRDAGRDQKAVIGLTGGLRQKLGADDVEDSEPTSVVTPGPGRRPEGPTMTEVGTKLDLARAYVDMGDPDGARSILNEVIEEGDPAQQQEARKLLDELAD